MLTQELINKALKEVSDELPNIKLSKKVLSKFTSSKEDQRFLGYANGVVGGSYHKMLPVLIKKLNLKNIVELGSREGISTACIWDTLLPDAKFTTIDIIHDQRYCPEEMYQDSRVNFIFGDVCDLSIFKDSIPMDIDFLFSDTIHYNFQISDEFEIYQHLLADKALVVIDDIYVNDKNIFFEKVKYLKWDLTELYHHSGFGMFLFERKEPLSKEERILNAYKASAKIWQRKCLEHEKTLTKIKDRSIFGLLKSFLKKMKPFYKIYVFSYNKLHAFYVKSR